MEKISVSDCKDSLQSLGRTFVSQNGGLFCNWTCCGVRFVFHGTALAAKIQGYPSAEQELNAMTAAFESRETWPWIAVFLDEQTLERRYRSGYLRFSDLKEKDKK